jgi:hypothetical protein
MLDAPLERMTMAERTVIITQAPEKQHRREES